MCKTQVARTKNEQRVFTCFRQCVRVVFADFWTFYVREISTSSCKEKMSFSHMWNLTCFVFSLKLGVLKTLFSKHGSRGKLMHQECCTLKWFERQIKKRKREQSIRRKGLSRAFGSFTLLQSPEKLKSAKGRFFGTLNLWGQMVQSWDRQILWLLKGNTSHFGQHQLNSTFAGRVF